jgi:GNAT superfamily N-acetyltransferase
MSFTIRSVQESDAPALADLVGEFEMYFFGSMKPKADIIARVRERFDTILGSDMNFLLTAWDEEGTLSGYASVDVLPSLVLPGPEAYLAELIVGEKWRGSGVGSILLDAVESEAAKRGCCRLMLITSRERESYEREFYKKKGWTERPEIANFIKMLL